ncbi:hypothetical protein KPA97_00635, partial [Burkholderia cenocepacia]|nr:hypothetical protein [Burkholderia cenocepacia]
MRGHRMTRVPQRVEARRIAGRHPADRERELVHRHRDVVQLDRAQHRGERHRHEAELPRVAEHQDVRA